MSVATTYLSLVVTMLFWGGTFIAGRSLAGSVPPAQAAFLRFAIASIALAVLTRLIDGRISLPPRKQWLSLVLLGMTGVFGYNMLFFTGLQHIGVVSRNPRNFRQSQQLSNFSNILT